MRLMSFLGGQLSRELFKLSADLRNGIVLASIEDLRYFLALDFFYKGLSIAKISASTSDLETTGFWLFIKLS